MSGVRHSLHTPPQSTGRGPSQTSQAGRGKSSGCSSSLSPLHKDHQSHLESLRVELEEERLRSKEAQRRFDIEARELREAAKREQQLLADKLQSRWEQQWTRDLDQLRQDMEKKRKAEIRQLLRLKAAELREAQELLQQERDTVLQQARELQSQLARVLVSCESGSSGARGGGSGVGLSSECRARLQAVLGKRQWEVESDQAAQIHHLRVELELQRRLFLKYILEHVEGEPLRAGSIHRSRQASSLQHLSRASPPDPESAIADATPDVLAVSKTSSLVNHRTRCESPCHCPLLGEESPMNSSSPEQPDEQALAKELYVDNEPEEEVSVDSPQHKVNSCESAEDQAPEGLPLQDQWPGNSCNLLLKQNADLLKALEVLEQTCTHLQDENTRLKKSSPPVLQEKVRLLKRKTAELDALTKRLDTITKEPPESALEDSDTPGPLSLNGSDTEQCKNMLPQKKTKDPNDPNSKNEQSSQLENQLLQQQKQCNIIRREVEEKQKRCEEVELKLQKVASENAQLSEENSQLHRKNKWTEKIEKENADLLGKLRQATEERDSALLLTKGLEVKVEHLEQLMKNMDERAESQQELELEHKKSYQVLREKAGAIQRLHLQSDDQRPFRLRCFLARYSYKPSNGQAELPLTAGEYVYIYGEMDEDGFYVGELMDGRRGFVPSNLVEEVAGNDLFHFISSEPSNISDDSYYEPSFSCHSANSPENSNSPDEDITASLLSDGQEGTPGEVHPPNLTLILNLRNITNTSAEVSWLPSNSNCPHRVYLEEETYDVTKAGVNCYTLPYLKPSRQYHVKVEPLVPTEALVSPQGGLELKAGELTFTTPSAGPPDPPRHVQIQAGSSADSLVISWSPVRIRPSQTSNMVPVIGYAIYINGEKITEIWSPTAGSTSIEVSQLKTFQGPQTVSVRTVSPFGESADSEPAFIPSNLQKVLYSFSSQSLGPGETCEKVHESEGNKDTMKRRPEACLTNSMMFNFTPDHREISADDSSAESSLEAWDSNSSSPEPSLSSIHLKIRKDPDVDTSAEDIFHQKDQGEQIKELCEDLAESTVSPVESQEEKTFKTGSCLVSIVDDSQGALLSDKKEEEEEEEKEEEEEE